MVGNSTGGGFLSLLIALLVVNVLLIAPGWLLPGGAGRTWLAVEAVAAVALFALLPHTRWRRIAAWGAAAVLILGSLLAFADAVFRLSLGRALNLYLDIPLAADAGRLIAGVAGGGGTLVAAVVVSAAGLLAVRVIAGRLMRIALPGGRRWTLAAAGAVAAVAALAAGTVPALGPRVAAPAARLAADQARHAVRMFNERDAFAAELGAAPADYASVPRLLHRLRGRDVLIAFVESYGMSAIEDPRYAPVLGPRLDALAARTSAAGLHLATGRLAAPTQGGQSWFSHLSLLSGLWVDNQLRYDLLLAEGRETLIDDFRRAGHRSAALMPANTLAWPEGERLGYDEIWTRRDIDYAGPALNWVTMPDQFTWSFLQRRIRRSGDPRPVFAELGLISSHAPWTPILPVLDDWDVIGDGAVFERWRDAGEPPHELWLDHDRVREHFALSVDYAVHAATGYAERYVDDRTLLIVLGDHQPAPLITGEDATRAVPVHVISGDPALVRPFLGWGFSAGARPDRSRPAAGMDAFRDWFVGAFSAADRDKAKRNEAG
ncbi:MAG: sulfatase [Acidobacteria bacterium]|nr:sulfatase [Acidobacteriota bacterium]